MTVTGAQWLTRFAEALGLEAPTPDEIEALLGLAGTAAHASERTAAPVSCWLAARAAVPPERARALAAELAAKLGTPPG